MKLLPLALLFFSAAEALLLTPEQASDIGLRIWQNECRGKVEGLASWNQGEEFASMGIAHFIWYPEGEEGCYKEQFVWLLSFLEREGISLPPWLQEKKGCPWPDKEAFENEGSKLKINELRNLLADTVALQIRFMAQRLEEALPNLLAATAPEQRERLRHNFEKVAEARGGLYALLDYLNFKGEGTDPKERYQGKGWGLLQLLELMPENSSHSPLADYVDAAKALLAQRVELAPSDRNEGRWLKGWYNRVESYNN